MDLKIRVKPYKGKWCSRRQAKRINDLLINTPRPDRTALKKEAEEFANILRERRLSRSKSL